ncbi:MAG: tRNA uridine-5-carboxymethylaminomethyl(34) synthesis GTPase MnmE [Hyphomicrobiales bacterium]|nr:tRNA uridine-5-carboxymethylaminomethyl(34) synthesis GTPase MnmE [Hyphomicrobiales bacterium]
MSETEISIRPDGETIVAIATAPGRAALGIVRISGPLVRFVADTICRRRLKPRQATHARFHGPDDRVLDDGIAVLFEAPRSATGEDVLELTCHGGRGVLASVLDAVLACGPGLRLAEAGEFTRRAFEAGKLDALQVEALADLLAAETEAQVRQARRQLDGELGLRVEGWRGRLIEARALIEATLDFSDEGDVDAAAADRAKVLAQAVADEIDTVLGDAARGERIREGLSVVIAGVPNTGKSTLLNALAGREVALVSPLPGTTRDRIEIAMEFDGVPVRLSDTAGVREAADPVEAMGVERTLSALAEADLVLSLASPTHPDRVDVPEHTSRIDVTSMADLGGSCPAGLPVSALTGDGLGLLRAEIARRIAGLTAGEPALVARARQRGCLEAALAELRAAKTAPLPELAADHVRKAADALGRLVGRVDVEDVLDRLFEGFCIGK